MSSSMKKASDKASRFQKIHLAAYDLAAEMDWQSVSLWMIAERAGVSLSDVQAVYADKNILLHDIVQQLDDTVLASFTYDPASSKKDQLFDVLMERFDAMEEHKMAHVSFLKSFGWVPCDKPRNAKLYVRSLERYLRAAGIETDGLFGAGRVAALSFGYLYVLYKWSLDESADLSPTMAALDKMLSRLNWAQDFIRSRYYQSA